MASEYVKLIYAEKVYGERNLLQTILSLLSIQKNLKQYKELRKQELDLRLDLKKKVQETKNALDDLEKNIPITKLLETERRVKKIEAAAKPTEKTEEEVMTTGLESEIRDVQKRLAQII